ncbi:PKD domain-containing protein [Georgenia yuyongxinii]|uniref:PKD domain-containing protein n=1 Tax=Georgenia yuyongxinii TaxID=2589797 RepID=A0A552WXT7_9MICO|nr:PKD domain-containing protein [Georgenia yuyongxinii]TRW47651.1 PKD domain-containing protein [Georgenia yuyongxinii]
MNRLRLFQDMAPGADFEFTVFAPDGTNVGTVPSAIGWTAWLPVPAALVNGRGVWTVLIDRAPGSSVAQPALLPSPTSPGNAVDEPYVSPYGNRLEGVLGVEFDGQELTPTVPSVTALVTLGPCDAAGIRGPTTLEVGFAPPLPPGWTYQVVWTTGVGPPITVGGTVPPGGPPLPSVTRAVVYVPGTYYPTASVVLTSPAGAATAQTIAFDSPGPAGTGVVVPPCPAPCHDIAISGPPRPCLPTGSSASVAVTITATFTPAMPTYAGPVTWQIRDGSGNLLPLGVPAPSGHSLTRSLGLGKYEVTASITRPAGCDPAMVSDSITVNVVDCNCATFTVDELTASSTDGCTFTFSAAVSPAPGVTTTYEWDFGSGPDPTKPNSPTCTHTFPAGTVGPRTVTLTARSPGCAQSVSTTVTVNCPTAPSCPTIAGPITVSETSPCTFDFVVPITNPSGAPVTITWDFGDGSSGAGASVTHSYTPGTYTVVARISSPGCPDSQASTTATCATTPPPPPPPPTGGGGCLCLAVVILALLLIAVAAVLFFAWACGGFLAFGAFSAATTAASAGLVLLGLWIALCRDCTAIRVLIDWATKLVVVALVAAAILALIGLPMCAMGALIVAGLLGVVLGVLNLGRGIIGCPA